jgi:hypothetical protein
VESTAPPETPIITIKKCWLNKLVHTTKRTCTYGGSSSVPKAKMVGKRTLSKNNTNKMNIVMEITNALAIIASVAKKKSH